MEVYMLDFSGINYFAVAIVWLLYMVIGAYWYSPSGFAKQWTKLTGIDIMKIPQKKATQIIMFVAVSALVQSVTLAVILHSLNVTSLINGLVAAGFLWLGLVAATTVGTTLYSKRSWKFLWLNSSYFLVVMLLGAAILSTWK